MMQSRREFLAIAASAGAIAFSPRSIFAAPSARLPVSVSETFMPTEWLAAMAEKIGAGGNDGDAAFWQALKKWNVGAEPILSEARLLSLPAPGVELFKSDLARNIAAASNDRLAEFVGTSKDSVGGLATIAAGDHSASAEAERAVTRLGLAGISLGANRGIRLDSKHLWPLYDFASSARVPIYLPSKYASLAGDVPYRAVGQQGILGGAASEAAAHATQLIFGGVLDAFPELQIILGRLGEGAPYWYSKIAAVSQKGEAWAPKRSVQEYFRENICMTPADVVSDATLQFCVGVLGQHRLLGSREEPRNA